MEAVTIMEFKGGAEDIARIGHPSPTYSETMKEAAYAAWTGKSIAHLILCDCMPPIKLYNTKRFA